IRIKHAVTLLDYGIDSIKNVALLSGFTDPLYFSNVFKAQIGISPTQYLKNKNEKKDN
ncbi:MAG: helix-turn-helix transcriptional regulator, partial [Clostridiales bacterium]|nr:helix-turn-helix transcriptional regulator [Clostridiales bacterium]